MASRPTLGQAGDGRTSVESGYTEVIKILLEKIIFDEASHHDVHAWWLRHNALWKQWGNYYAERSSYHFV